MAADEIKSPAFLFEIGWAQNYEDLFRGHYTTSTSSDRVLEKAVGRGRVMLHGRGGSGKTTIVLGVRSEADKRGFATFLVNMARWSPRFYEMLERLDPDPLARANFLLENLGDPPSSFYEIDKIEPSRPKLVIVDGLNEVRSDIGRQFLTSADKLASAFLNLSVITTDRLARRDIAIDRWTLGMVLPLKESLVRSAVEENLGRSTWDAATLRDRMLLENPFFLDKVLKDKRVTFLIGDYLLRFTGLSNEDLDRAASGAMATYRAGFGARSFPRDAFVKEAGTETTMRLMEAGILEGDGESAHFQHHLFHDYLAARWLAGHPNEWNEKTFDALTFKASSFDAISEVLAQLESDQADNFIRQVYDWNPYAAAYAISQTGPSDARVSKEMAQVITAMLADRKWDLICPTATQAKDALAILGTNQATYYLEAKTREEILAAVEKLKSETNWFRKWQWLFTRPSGTTLRDREIELLKSDDSILGWTAANVFRRLNLGAKELRDVRHLARTAQTGNIRWRAVHVLGAYPTGENERVLFERLRSDDYEWVRYGALRSLMEMAASSAALRKEILEAVSREADLIATSERLKSEFSRAAKANVSKKDVGDWTAQLGRVVRALADRARDENDLEGWARLSRELTEKYAAA
jgi:hypothetical protein